MVWQFGGCQSVAAEEHPEPDARPVARDGGACDAPAALLRGALARQEIALRSLASHEFMGELVDQGRLLKNKPNNSFQQLNGKK